MTKLLFIAHQIMQWVFHKFNFYISIVAFCDNHGIKFTNNFLEKIKEYKITILNLNVASFRYLKFFKNL